MSTQEIFDDAPFTLPPDKGEPNPAQRLIEQAQSTDVPDTDVAKAMAEWFEREQGVKLGDDNVAVDEGEPTPSTTEESTTATPDGDTATSTDTDTPGEETEETDTEPEPVPDVTVAPPPSPTTSTWDSWDEQTRSEAIETYNWATSLPPQVRKVVDDALSGDYYLVHRTRFDDKGNFIPDPGNPSPGAGSSSPSLVPSPSGEGDDYSDDPRLGALAAKLDQLLAAENQRQQAENLRQQSEYQAQASRAVTDGQNAFNSRYNLPEDELSSLVQAAGRSGVIPVFAAQYRGDPAKALDAALEHTYWTNPTFRQKAMEAFAQTQIDASKIDDQQLTEKKKRAAALSGAGGPVNRSNPTPKPQTQEERDNAMVAELTEIMTNAG